MPTFSFRHVKDLYQMMWMKAHALVDRISLDIQEHPAKGQNLTNPAVTGTVEINNWASKITLDIIGVAGLGREFNALKDSDDQLVKHYEELLEPSSQKLLFFIMKAYVNSRFTEMLPWKMNEIFERITTSLRGMCRSMVRENSGNMKSGEQHFDILSLLIKANDFSDDELVDQLLTFLAAGRVFLSSEIAKLTMHWHARNYVVSIYLGYFSSRDAQRYSNQPS
jgi:cytochrome P450